MSIQKMDHETTAKKAAEARSFFCGKEDAQRFFDLTSYNEHARVYAGFGSVLDGLFDNFARKILLGLPTPPLVERFFDELIGPLKAYGPDLIGFSILFSQQLFFALALAKLCRVRSEPASRSVEIDAARPPNPAKLPRAVGAKIVFGGATFSVMPDPGRLLAGPVPVYLGGELGEVDAGRLIDYLFVGEGEKGLESLVEFLAARCGQDASEPVPSRLCRIPGLLHMDDGKPVRNPPAAAIST